jgi:hypothetical protein
MPENAKVITTAALIEKFEQALSEKWGYIWGTAGENWTAAKQKELEKTTDSDRAQGRKYGSKWIGHKVADCSGLFSWAFKQLGGYMYHGSDTMFRKYCTETGELKKGKRADGQELEPGSAVFVWNGKKYGHVGLYIGNGTVIEAMGTQNGVTTSKITATKWTHWGELKGVTYDGSVPAADPADPAEDNVTKWRPTIRKGSKGTVVREMQEMLDKLGYSLGICGIDGDYGTATAAAVRAFQSDNRLVTDGVCGPMTWDALEKAIGQIEQPPAESEKVYAVIISGLDKTQAETIAANYPANSRIVEGSVA